MRCTRKGGSTSETISDSSTRTMFDAEPCSTFLLRDIRSYYREASAMSLSGKSRISVAMCTYNGERFLAAQLESIVQQTRLPDELVVCDDASTDQTLSIVR